MILPIELTEGMKKIAPHNFAICISNEILSSLKLKTIKWHSHPNRKQSYIGTLLSESKNTPLSVES